jgi:predicted CoA-binding protein
VTGDGRLRNPAVTECCALLKRVKTIAVLGLSPDPSRPSHGVARAMQGFGYTIIPVHPTARDVLGAKAYPSLADVPVAVDLVDVFRRAEHIDGIVNDCLRLEIKSLWIQERIINEPAGLRAQAGGVRVVMDRCIYRDYVKYCR